MRLHPKLKVTRSKSTLSDREVLLDDNPSSDEAQARQQGTGSHRESNSRTSAASRRREGAATPRARPISSQFHSPSQPPGSPDVSDLGHANESSDAEIIAPLDNGSCPDALVQDAFHGTETLGVLLLEDSPTDAALIERALAEGAANYTLHRVSRLRDAVQLLRDMPASFGVILADLSLPDSFGLDTVRRLRHEAPDMAIVVLTSQDSDEVAMQSLYHGAQDFLVKDCLTFDMLDRAMRYAVQRQMNGQMRLLLGRVRDSERLLERKNRRLQRLYHTAHRFVDNVSHEFRTPLTVMKEYVSLINEGLVGPLNAEQSSMLDVVSDRTDDLNNMVDDLLDVSKLNAGILGASRRYCQLSRIIEHVIPSLERKARVKQVSLEMAIDPDLPEVYCDPDKVVRVIVNLSINATKFCGEPGLVRLWARLGAGGRDVEIGVTDNGAGIEQQSLQVIFRRFKQLRDNPRGSTKGVGLGLNIVKELVNLNLGSVYVDSTPGEGSTFSFTVPTADPQHIVQCYLRHLKRRSKRTRRRIALVVARVDDEAAICADDANAFLTYLLRRDDLLLRIDPLRWLLVMPCTVAGLKQFLERAESVWVKANRNRPYGPLPAVTYERVGAWHLHDERDELLDYARQLFSPEEVVHA